MDTLEQSSLKSQTPISLEQQASGAIRQLTAKLRQAVSVAASNVAENIAPGQGEKLLELADLNGIIDRRSSNTSTSSHTSIDEQYLQYLISMYQSYDEKGLPLSEQVRVLSSSSIV